MIEEEDGRAVIQDKVLYSSRKYLTPNNRPSNQENDPWCKRCTDATHTVSQCWKDIFCTFCKKNGHPTERCYNNPDSKNYKPKQTCGYCKKIIMKINVIEKFLMKLEK